jgi:competence protein ComEC
MAAILLGEREDLPADLEDALKRAGVYHIVALSGQNVGMVLLLCSALLRLLPVGGASRRVLLGLGLALYWAVARGSGSISRAALMAFICLAGGLCERRVVPLAALSVTVVLMLATNPAWSGDAGFQLSFVATLGLLTFMGRESAGRARRRGRALAWLVLSLRLSASALLVTAAISAHHFHRLTPSAIVANLLAVPAAGGVLVIALAVVALEPLLPGVAHALCLLAGLLIDGLGRTAALLAAPPWLSFHVLPPGSGLVLWSGIAAIAAGAAPRTRERRLALAGALTALALIAVAGRGNPPTGKLELTALDVGQGDSILVRFPDGASMLIDSGGFSRTSFDVGARVVAPALRALGCLTIDILAITHAHRDHLGGAAAVLREFSPGAVWLGWMPEDDPGVRAILMMAAARRIPVLFPRRGVRLRVGGASLEFLNPASRNVGSGPANDDSLVVRISYARRRALLMGDLEAPREAELVAEGRDLAADLLKVGHHGSRTSTTSPFLMRVAPSLAIISVGVTNPWGHPDPEVLDRLRAAGVRILRTDETGAVRVSTDGLTPWSVESPWRRRAGDRGGSEKPWTFGDYRQDENDKTQEGYPQAPAPDLPALVEGSRMPHAEEGKQETEQDQVPSSQQETDPDQEPDPVARNVAVCPPGDGVQHMAPIQLSNRKEIEACGQHADPAGREHRVETQRHARPGIANHAEEDLEKQAGRESDVTGLRELMDDHRARKAIDEDRHGHGKSR